MKNELLVKVRGFIIEIGHFIVFMVAFLICGWVLVILRWISDNLSLKEEVKKFYDELFQDKYEYY